jgi:hypothetical protein
MALNAIEGQKKFKTGKDSPFDSSLEKLATTTYQPLYSLDMMPKSCPLKPQKFLESYQDKLQVLADQFNKNKFNDIEEEDFEQDYPTNYLQRSLLNEEKAPTQAPL